MSTMEDCIKTSLLEFTAANTDDETRFDFRCTHSIIEKCFSIPVTSKREIGKAMLKYNVIITYNIADNMVTNMLMEKRTDDMLCNEE